MYTTPVTFYRLVLRGKNPRIQQRWQLLTCAGYEFDLVTPDPLEPDDVIDFWRRQVTPESLWDEFVAYHYADTWGFLNSAGRLRHADCDEWVLTKAIRNGMRYHTRYPAIINGDADPNIGWKETMPQNLLEKYGHGTPPAESGWPNIK